MAVVGRVGFVAVALIASSLRAAPAPPPAANATAAPSAPATSVRFVDFLPTGTVSGIRQARARFATSMVALGDPAASAPFVVDCPTPGQGRWLDGNEWVYDFDADLPSGQRCRFTLRRGLVDLAGVPVTAQRSFTFDTGGPSVVASLPSDGTSGIDEEQVFLLRLDGPATPESIRAHAHCTVEGLAEALPVTLLEGRERAAVLAQRRTLGYGYRALLRGEDDGSEPLSGQRLRQAEAGLVAVRCARPLPPDARVQLQWGPGLQSPSGLRTRVAQRFIFEVRPQFTARVECTRANAGAGCLPMKPIEVRFSAPVPRAIAERVRVESGGRLYRPAAAKTAAVPVVDSVRFDGPFAEGAVAKVTIPPDLRDDAGRPLANASRFPVDVRVDAAPPLAKFSGTFGIIELEAGPVLPVTLRSVDGPSAATDAVVPAKVVRVDADPRAIYGWLARVETAMQSRGEWIPAGKHGEQAWKELTGSTSVFPPGADTEAIAVPKPAGTEAFEVVGIPLSGPGLFVVELASRRLGDSLLGPGQTRYVATAALVTNLAVHFKWGRESSLVWVTRLDDGRPVPGAAVTIADPCTGAARWSGRTGRDGIALAQVALGEPRSYGSCDSERHPLLAMASVGADFSFALSTWGEGIAPWNFGLNAGGGESPDLYHTVFDRALFRPGETVSMKHYLRRHALAGIVLPGGLPATRKVTISHQGSDQKYVLEPRFDAAGIADHQWVVPAGAAAGTYDVEIAGPDGERHSSGSFKVGEFRVPTMRATVSGPARTAVRPGKLPVDLQVTYLSGGGADGMPVTLRTYFEPAPLRFRDYADYQFGGTAPTVGISVNGRGGAESDVDDEAGPPDARAGDAAPRVRTEALVLGAGGATRVEVPAPTNLDEASVMVAELEYPDANGELLSAVGRVRISPSAIAVGIRADGWTGTPDSLRFRIAVVDLDGKPVAGRSVKVDLYSSTYYSYRRRLVGGFYAYESAEETRQLPVACAGTTDRQGLLACNVAPGVSGQVLLHARASDDAGRRAESTTTMWVAGDGDWWFEGGASDRMDVIPEKKEYRAGDVARLQVRMPFRKATALVTIEREGVLRGYVRTIDGRKPLVEVPVDAVDAPNVFVSVLAVRGRVPRPDDAKAAGGQSVTALVDLNKPAFRLGIAPLTVGWAPNRLDVAVDPARKVYGVRQQAEVVVRVRRADGGPLPAGAEVAFAAVDAGLLELAPNGSWKLLDAMMGERGLDVQTFTAQSRVVGKRHYGRKAIPHGGGGGREGARQSFDTLLAWRARVPVGPDGTARVVVPINDSLTTFRLVAVASAGSHYFGTGTADIVSTQDVILFAGLPQKVRQGDRFLATFTVRNAAKAARRVTVTASVNPGGAQPLPPRTLELAAGEARDVAWDYTVPSTASRLEWTVQARLPDGSDADRLVVAQAAVPKLPVSTQQATLVQVVGAPKVRVARPAGAEAGRGGVEVAMTASLAGGLQGVREYMSSYPYDCIEQQASVAIALASDARWNAVVATLPSYLDDDGLLRYFPNRALPGDDVLTAYLLAIADASGRRIPEASRERMLAGLASFLEGRSRRDSALPTGDLTVRRLAAIAALARYGKAKPAMLDSVTIDPARWPTSAVLDWIDILSKVRGIPSAGAKATEARRVLRARLVYGGTRVGFTTARTDTLPWLMQSTDANAARVLIASLDAADWRADAPRLARGLLALQSRGHWGTTVANAWGVVAITRYTAKFEATPVSGETAIALGNERRTVTWPVPEAARPVELPWPGAPADLVIDQRGTGQPWALVSTRAAIPVTRASGAGFKVTRRVEAVERATPGAWTRGDIVRVHLDLESMSEQTWVVVADPVPAGATLLGGGLGGQSALAVRGETARGAAWLAYTDRRQGEFRAFYRFVPKGRWSVEYTMRLDNPGTFGLPASRVEAMYAPDWHAVAPNGDFVVQPR